MTPPAESTAVASLPGRLDDRTLDLLPGRESSPVKRRGALIRRALLVADLLGLSLAFMLTELLFGSAGARDHLPLTTEYVVFVSTLPIWIASAKLYRLYDRDEERADHTTLEDLPGVFHLITVGTFFLMLGTALMNVAQPLLAKLALFWILAIVAVTLMRIAARLICRRSPVYLQNTVIVGAGQVGQLVARKLRMHGEYGFNLVGFVDAAPMELREDLDGLSVLGDPESLPHLVRLLRIDRVVIAFSGDSHEETLELIASLRDLNVQIDIVPRFFEGVGMHTRLHSVESLPLLALPTAKPFPFAAAIKRAVDVVGAAAGLIVMAPVFAYAAWRISRESDGPVFFRQRRVGRDMREFTVLKFRTMRSDVDDTPHREYIRQTMTADATQTHGGLYKLERQDAVTPFGRILRKTSLDELPQLINVLRGDMSLVGPRPCLDYELEHFRSQHFERFRVLPGITGLWQVSARAHSTFGEALDMDVTYSRNWSLGLDLWLLFRTPLHLLRLKGTA
jgi:exopolysaccharide biosynthesis polyprenyl glycosylphosphotransferase